MKKRKNHKGIKKGIDELGAEYVLEVCVRVVIFTTLELSESILLVQVNHKEALVVYFDQRLGAAHSKRWSKCFFYLLTTQTHTIRGGALRFATQISPLLNKNIAVLNHLNV